MRSLVLFFLTILMFLLSDALYALDPERDLEQYNVNEWGVDQQLPQISVTALAQDSKGYIWVGTQSGVARFNGKDFVAFDRSNTQALESNIITDLLVDNDSNLWILTASGLTLRNSTGFISLKSPNKQVIKPSQLIRFSKKIIFSSASGLFEVKQQTIQPYVVQSESYALEVFQKNLIVGGRGQITIVSGLTASVKRLPTKFDKAIVKDIQAVGETLWLATTKGLLFYRDNQFEQLSGFVPLINESTNALYLDENGLLWVATDIATYRLANGILHNNQEKASFPRVSTFMLDKDGTLWLGTSDRGLFQLWNSWSVRFADYHGINESLIWSVAGSQLSDFVVGSDSGIYKYQGNRFYSFISKYQLPNASVYTLFIDRDKSLWAGTKGGIAHFDPLGNRLKNDLFGALDGLQINAIYRDSIDRLWVLTEQGAYYRENNQLINVAKTTAFEAESFRAIAEVDQNIYLGSQTGLLQFGADNKLKAIDDDRLKTFITVLENYKGRLLVGTYSEGLFINDANDWKNLSKSNGLLFNDSFSISQLDGALWISGFDGVYRIFFTRLDQFINGQSDQIISDPILKDSGYVAGSQKAYCCNGAGHAKAAVVEGDLWFPTRNGVLKLEPDKVVKNQTMVETVVENVSNPKGEFDLYFYLESTAGHDHIAFDEKDITFKYIGLTSFDEGLVKYRYRLVGYSPKWIENGVKRTVSYTNLPSGDYIFEVVASNSNGLWSNKPTQLAFSINPLYYETFFFKIVLFFLGLAVLYGMYRLVIYRNRVKVAFLRAQVSKKTKALRISNQKLEEANDKLSVYSFTDPLTGAHNRRYFVKQIVSDISHYVRISKKANEEENLILLIADIDFFKDINDQYGHNAGDEILKQVVDSLRNNIRDGDYLIRWGGEEFLLVLRPDHVAGIEDMCNRLLSRVNKQDYWVNESEKIHLSLSLGFCFYPLVKQVINNWSWEDALDFADKALYQAKSNGRNQWVGYQMLPSTLDNFSPSSKSEMTLDDFQKFSGNNG